MPLTAHGERMKKRMEAEYGKDTGDRVLYASKNAGKKAFQDIERGGRKKRHHKRSSKRK